MRKKTVLVAMSGGVDSSVAAALLKKGGFQVVGVFMKPWQPADIKVDCFWKKDREDALRVAAKLDIPLLTWDFSEEYKKHVAEYMIEGYRQGITPNPDVMCNKFIKFGVFLERALNLGADYIATGHYICIKIQRGGPTGGPPPHGMVMSTAGVRRDRTPIRFSLHTAKDKNKDQSYFLYALTQEQLKHCLFPIGDYDKKEVRKMARKFGLSNWDKKDSQGVCFIGPLDMDEFLKKHIKPRKGQIVRESDGQILGEHDGAWYYTIGQRHGFNLSAGKPYFIVGKDINKNVLYVGGNSGSNRELRVKDFNWINKKTLPLDCRVRTRYRQKDLECSILENGSDNAFAKIKGNNILAAPGQSAVFYKENEVLGGGIIV